MCYVSAVVQAWLQSGMVLGDPYSNKTCNGQGGECPGSSLGLGACNGSGSDSDQQ